MDVKSSRQYHIITWNVNGLRAWFKKGAMEWITSQTADIICLQEIRAQPEQLSQKQHAQIDGYWAFWNPAERPGYSGVLSLSQVEPEQVLNGLGDGRFDVEGRVIATHQAGIWLFNVYFPNGRRDLSRLDYKLEFYQRMLDRCDELHAAGDQIVIAGDFNTAHNNIDLKNPKQNAGNTGFLPEERAWIDRYLKHGFVDAYREFHPNREQYTWWTYRFGARRRNIGWRLDYFLVTENLMDRIRDVTIHDDIQGSDHCPVSLVMKV